MESERELKGKLTVNWMECWKDNERNTHAIVFEIMEFEIEIPLVLDIDIVRIFEKGSIPSKMKWKPFTEHESNFEIERQ